MPLLTALALATAIMGAYSAFQGQGMLLRPLKDTLDQHLPIWLRKPIYDCPVCMSSIWTILYYLTIGIHDLTIAQTAWLLLMVAGINTWCCIALEKLTDYGC
jgi:hypothetical protein